MALVEDSRYELEVGDGETYTRGAIARLGTACIPGETHEVVCVGSSVCGSEDHGSSKESR